MTVWENIDSLKFGDFVEIEWLDASESTIRLERAHARFDTLVRSVGSFLGVKGRRTKPVMTAKEIIDNAKAYACIHDQNNDSTSLSHSFHQQTC